ncbi:P-loop containing nucleoside triphosphate hydrolase protein, partial [Lasiosphaeria miniovina]
MQHKDEVDDNGNLSNNSEAQTLSSELTYQIAALGPKLQAYNGQGVTDLRNAVADATGVSFHVPVSLNKHFVVRRSVQSFYTGREQQMSKITAAFEQPLSQTQRRFVVYGLGGSGKTELALKYAQDNAQKFWGVFFVDASTRKSAAGSYAEIAKIGGVDHNEKAAQHWLATRSVPWLLVVDNADSETALDDLLPSGTKGCILVTSRNPAHKSYGTSGERFLELKDMNVEEANELILKVAEEPRPWDTSVQDTASAICTALGYLPLAIVHAGKAVLHNLCSWNGYLEYYERSIKLIRRQWHSRRDRSSSRNRRRRQEDDASMNVFSTYEILYRNLELRQDEEDHKDAVQLLQVFSFFHCHDIRLDTLISAAVGPTKEAKARQKSPQSQEDEEASRRLAARKGSLSSWLTTQAYRVYKFLETPPPLPDVLKNTDNLDDEDFEANVGDRLRAAMRVLISMSLVARQDRLEERYSIHPLVHRWIRERPQISTSEQALWCQMATTVLARSIPLPPLGGSDDELSKRLKLLPHIMHVR